MKLYILHLNDNSYIKSNKRPYNNIDVIYMFKARVQIITMLWNLVIACDYTKKSITTIIMTVK